MSSRMPSPARVLPRRRGGAVAQLRRPRHGVAAAADHRLGRRSLDRLAVCATLNRPSAIGRRSRACSTLRLAPLERRRAAELVTIWSGRRFRRVVRPCADEAARVRVDLGADGVPAGPGRVLAAEQVQFGLGGLERGRRRSVRPRGTRRASPAGSPAPRRPLGERRRESYGSVCPAHPRSGARGRRTYRRRVHECGEAFADRRRRPADTGRPRSPVVERGAWHGRAAASRRERRARARGERVRGELRGAIALVMRKNARPYHRNGAGRAPASTSRRPRRHECGRRFMRAVRIHGRAACPRLRSDRTVRDHARRSLVMSCSSGGARRSRGAAPSSSTRRWLNVVDLVRRRSPQPRASSSSMSAISAAALRV